METIQGDQQTKMKGEGVIEKRKNFWKMLETHNPWTIIHVMKRRAVIKLLST